MNSYYIHFTPLNDRLVKNLPLLLRGGLSPQVVSETSAEPVLLERASSGLQNPSQVKLLLAQHVSIIFPHLKSNLLQLSPGLLFDDIHLTRSFLRSTLSPSLSTIEHTCQHIHCLKDSLISGAKTPILVLEDDALPIEPNFLKPLRAILSQPFLNHDAPFMIDLGQGLGLKPDNPHRASNHNIERVDNGRTRCSFAYLISTAACRQIVDLTKQPHFFPYLPSDWYLSLLMTVLEIPTYWSILPIFTQGSETGLVKSNQLSRTGPSMMPAH
jgi:hypothetical protein